MRTWMGRSTALVLLMTASCGGGSPAADAGTDAGPQPIDAGATDAGRDAGPPLASLRFRCVAGYWDDVFPIDRVDVAFTQGDVSIEAISDSEGLATIEGIDWTRGPASVAISLPVYRPWALGRGFAGFGERDFEAFAGPDGVIEVALMDFEDPVAITGTALGMLDEAHLLTVTSDTHRSLQQAPGAAFAFNVAADRPFRLVGLEWIRAAEPVDRVLTQTLVQWALGEYPATAEPTSVELDFRTPAPVVRVSGSFAIPRSGLTSFDEEAFGYVRVYGHGTAMTPLIGLASATRVTADGEDAEFDAEYVALEGEYAPRTFYSLHRGWEYSSTSVAGYPGDGPLAAELWLPPMIDSPAGSEPLPYDEPIEWGDDVPAGASVAVRYFRGVPGGQVATAAHWWVAPGASSFTPAPFARGRGYPFILGPESGMTLTADVIFCERSASAREFCDRFAGSRSFGIGAP